MVRLLENLISDWLEEVGMIGKGRIWNGSELQVHWRTPFRNGSEMTSKDTHRVGEIINAPISFFRSGDSRFRLINFSRIGITKAKVFPEPVTAYTINDLKENKGKNLPPLLHLYVS